MYVLIFRREHGRDANGSNATLGVDAVGVVDVVDGDAFVVVLFDLPVPPPEVAASKLKLKEKNRTFEKSSDMNKKLKKTLFKKLPMAVTAYTVKNIQIVSFSHSKDGL